MSELSDAVNVAELVARRSQLSLVWNILKLILRKGGKFHGLEGFYRPPFPRALHGYIGI